MHGFHQNQYFGSYLKDQRARNDPIGELARFAEPYHKQVVACRSRFLVIRSFLQQQPDWTLRLARALELAWEAYRADSVPIYGPTELGGHSVAEMEIYVNQDQPQAEARPSN